MKLSYVATLSFIYLLFFSITGISKMEASPIKVVVIDAGHGGKDPGAIGITGVKEKDVVLKLALQLGNLIEKNHPEIKVVYTRKTDVFVELHQRTQIANDNNADLFISIHCNAVDKNSGVHGAETFVMNLDKSDANLAIAQKENAAILKEQNHEANYGGFDPSSPESYIIFSLYQNKYLDESIKLAAAIQSGFKTMCKRQDRGVKQAAFLVLWRSAMPSVLVEVGFLSNKEEEMYLSSAKGQTELATAMYNGFAKMADKKTIEVDFSGVDTTTKPAKIEPEVKPNPNVNNAQTDKIYKVQFMTTPLKLDKNDPKLKGLPDVEIIAAGNDYRYTTGKCTTQVQASELLKKTKEVGFKDAFIVTVFEAKTETKPKTKPEIKQETKPATPEKPIVETPKETKPVVETSSSEVIYKIQFMAYPQKLEVNNPKLKGLPDIGIEPYENTFRYTSGKYNTYSQAKEALINVKEKFKDAFIVCYNSEGKRITLKEAQSLENKK